MKITTLLIFLFLSHSVMSLVCQNTRLQFFSHFSLGRQDQLNRTFTAISKNITIPNIDWNATPTDKYWLGNYTIHWRYIDNNQKANITGHDSVTVWGGHLRLSVSFNWTRTGTANKTGTGQASANTDPIHFTKDLVINNQSGYVMWNLANHSKISFDQTQFEIARINPYDAQDLVILNKMMNHLVNASGFKDYFLQGVNILMDFYLNESLHQEHFQQERFVNYTYHHPTKGDILVQYDIIIGSAIIQTDGLHIFSSEVIKNYNDQICGKQVTNQPRDPKTYGGLQTFISFGLISNTAKWGLANGVYDSQLNQHNWESRHFQFYAGDLYDVIPNLQKKYYPDTPLNGTCKALDSGFSVLRGSQQTLNITLNYNCSINVNSTRIIDFSIESNFQIKGTAYSNHLDFTVQHAHFNATYHQSGEFAVVNKQLADYYLNSSSWAIRGFKVFGSNFSIIARDYPHFQISKDEYIFIYDSSHIGTGFEDEL